MSATAAPEVIPPATCGNCPALHPMDAMTGECRYKPPQSVIVPIQDLTGATQMAVQTFFPRVQLDAWCSYHPGRFDSMGADDEDEKD